MTTNKKAFTLRLNPENFEKIKIIAEHDKRSIAKQIEYLIEQHIEEFENKKAKELEEEKAKELEDKKNEELENERLVNEIVEDNNSDSAKQE
ncbi:hypothetical protein NST83_07015 [Paenibacillus sp. FSL R10-2782]|uniref:hypothetical protein n=1 Tax=Paenibacillus TaxID=44249 RepID=UPI0006975490|nr:hypothetical protein [Paenibacillus terrae]